MNKPALALILAGSALFLPSGHAFWGVGDIVHDPVTNEAVTQKNIFDQMKYAWEQGQWAEKLATLHNTLTTVREHLQIAIMVKQAIGDPSQIPALLDELALEGMLSESGILETLGEFGGLVQEAGILAMQLDYLSQPIDLAGWKNAARMGTFYAFTYNSDPLARYIAVEHAYLRYNAQLQSSAYRAKYMRTQLNRLHSRLGSSRTDAETQKVQGSLTTADAALQDIEKSIELSADQVHVARTLASNRQDQEREAYRATLDELNHEVEANLELPVEEIAEVTPNF